MSNEYANVDLPALENLQSQLRKTASVLKEYSESINSLLWVTSGEWNDSRYEKFADDFRQHRSEIEEISEAYMNWANGYLNEKIEKIKAYNNR